MGFLFLNFWETSAIILVISGRGGMVDTLVLEANAYGVKVQVLSPAPYQRPYFSSTYEKDF